MQALRKKLFKKVKPKMLAGKLVTPMILLKLCKAYIKTINEGNAPNILST